MGVEASILECITWGIDDVIGCRADSMAYGDPNDFLKSFGANMISSIGVSLPFLTFVYLSVTSVESVASCFHNSNSESTLTNF